VNDSHRLIPSPIWHFESEELASLAEETVGNPLNYGERFPSEVCGPVKREWLPNISESTLEPMKPIRRKLKKQILLKHGLSATFAFPIYAAKKLQAVLEFFSPTSEPPDMHLLHVVQSIGEQLGRALERKQSEEQQRQAMTIVDSL